MCKAVDDNESFPGGKSLKDEQEKLSCINTFEVLIAVNMKIYGFFGM
jgi:hypothetical protein